jgi:RecA/RadA recombinase
MGRSKTKTTSTLEPEEPEEKTENQDIMENLGAELAIARLTKKYGEGCFTSSNKILERPRRVVSISPAANKTIGGVPEGSWMSITGPEKVGKTTFALKIAANCQKLEYGVEENGIVRPRNVYIGDIEGRLKEMNLRGTHDLQEVQIIRSTEKKIYSSEDFLNIIIGIIKNDLGACVIIDSISALCDSGERDSDVGSQARGKGNQWIAQFTRKLNQLVPIRKSIVICMSHLIGDSSGKNKSGYIERTCRALLYQADIKIRASHKSYYPADSDEPVGQEIHWKVECSALGHVPNQKFTSFLRFGYGIDEVWEAIKLGLSVGLIKLDGSWYKCTYLENHLDQISLDEPPKAQGMEKLRNSMIQNPLYYDLLVKDLKELS